MIKPDRLQTGLGLFLLLLWSAFIGVGASMIFDRYPTPGTQPPLGRMP